MSFLLFITVSKRAKKKNSRGYENIQLSAGDGSCLQVHFRITAVHFTGLRYHHGMVQRDPCIGALLVGFLCCMLQKKQKNKKDNRACVLHYCQDKIQERQSKEALKTQLINIRQSQTTQLLLHNCPIK